MPLTSSVDAWNKRVEAMNASQKADMGIITIENMKKTMDQVAKLEKAVHLLEQKVDKLENEGV